MKDVIFAFLEPAAPVELIHAHDNGPRAAKPYIAMRIMSAPRLPVHHGAVADDGSRLLSAHRDAMVELQCFGGGAYDLLDAMVQRLMHEESLALADTLNLAVYEIGQIQSIPVLRNAHEFEPRAVIELGIRYTGTTTEQVGCIETVNGEGTTGSGAVALPPVSFTATVETTPP